MANKQNKKARYLFLLLGLLILFFFILIVNQLGFFNLNTKSTSLSKTSHIVPTISLSYDAGWKIFMYPDVKKGFSFEFPSTWDIKIENISDDLATIIFTFKENSENYTFSINADQTGEYYGSNISSVDEVKTYNMRKINIKTISEDGVPFSISAYFEDYDPEKDGIMIINMKLPRANQEKYQLIFNKILLSLKTNN